MSARKFDIESFRNGLLAIVQDNLPAKVAAINTEKDDTNSISVVDNAYYYNDITDQVVNKTPFIYYGLIDVGTRTVGSQTAMEVTAFFSIVFDNRNQGNTESKTLRYTRCLREVIQENFKKMPAASNLKIEQFLPANFSLNKGADFKIGGIHITATITG